jgi:glycosyltransferase involved in cell wall biosynthesis
VSRIAFVSPLPPAPTGIADYAAEVLALLSPGHEIDAFHAQDGVDAHRLPSVAGVHRAETLLERNRERPYDAVVYQMGNGPEHDFLYPLLPRLPGLLVLHDLVLHHARARMFLDSPEARAYAQDPADATRRDAARPALDAYRAELAYGYPGQAARLFEAQLGTVGTLPRVPALFRLPVEASRLTAVHNDFMAEAVRAAVPEAAVARVAMPASAAPVAPGAMAALRARLGLAPEDFVVGSFGLLTAEKQVETVARAVARAAVHVPRTRLLLVGPVPDPRALARRLEERGIAGRTVVTGRVPFGELAAHMEAADVAVHLRYPTARETSAALLRLLAQGRPVVMSDLEHLADVPDDAVVRADPADEEGAVTRALLFLSERPAARARLGARARAFAAVAHAPSRCRADYDAALAQAAARRDPPQRSLARPLVRRRDSAL